MKKETLFLSSKTVLGKIVLNRQIVRAPYHEFYDTNYIYDEWGNLHVVLPPRASDYIKSGNLWNNASSFILRDYAYLYKYDKRFRITAKRLPGQDWIRYVYDKADYPVFTQDGEQRKRGEWSFPLLTVWEECVLQEFVRILLSFLKVPLIQW